MRHLELKNQPPDGLIAEFDLGDFKASWVGEYPPAQGVAFGADDGRILLVNKDWGIVGEMSPPDTDEAVNGLAFLPDWIGISTRAEVCFVDIATRQDPTVVRASYGAHGVIVGPHGQFLAPLGTTGLLSFKPTKEENAPLVISRPRSAELYFYRVISLIDPNGAPVVAAATRRDGIAAMPWDSPERGIHTLTFEGLNAIDLCPLREASLAVAALGKDGTIMMCRDVIEETLTKQASATIRFPDIRGIAYRVLHAAGNLIVVTSQAIYFLGNLASNFLAGKSGPVTILEFPIKAIDATTIGEHLMIVTSRGVLKLDSFSAPLASGQNRGRTVCPVCQAAAPQIALLACSVR